MGIVLYWLGINLYLLVLRIAALFHPKAKLFVKGRKGLLPQIKYALINERRPRIWMHCASLGEFEQGRPVLEQLRKDYPQFAFVLTFFSPSGYEVRKNYEGADYVFYLPTDSARNARLFLEYVQPKLCLFVKYDFWYYFLSAIGNRDIPLLLVSAIFRDNQGFFKWYGQLQRRMLFAFTHIFVQNSASQRLLQKIGYDSVTVSGDTRFDRVIEALDQPVKDLPKIRAFCNQHKILVAGSTWPDDERLLHKAFAQLPENWKLILVPHEVHEAHIYDLEKLWGDVAGKWSDETDWANKRVVIIDTVGLLLQLYRCGDIAWIGGGFGKAGVHNVLEPAVYGMPCLYGPVYHQFLEAIALVACGGGFEIESPEQLVNCIRYWETEPDAYTNASKAAAQYVKENAGATQKITSYLVAKNCISMV
ncbi:3-deoxy-D-manno-octulosonic acid transferase [Taibaiella soli]|uniref:3-deoxy-D-manno-octulosonic acid transferase n=1 Tax=Taibaiella soli TaxID=1649169 RepID=A0A2W2AJV1_9BACT|nr:glycosyltransferase N-terminal domain-containing protein [Taibaiella soli]PZF72510.1 3-deoxy-D-manno-octulosonic acid transferase [Taibaiella soli]